MRAKALFILVLLTLALFPAAAQERVTRTTLRNGLRVVIVPDPLAPVVSIYENYQVGADETPAGFPGMAHAQEHMTFRGCSGLSGDQIDAIFAQLGDDNNAYTRQNVTQYVVTVPTHDLEAALRLDSSCMKGVADSQKQWEMERGAIEQEVASDLSDPSYRLMTRIDRALFAGTPYALDAVGTKRSFDATSGKMLKQFHDRWYAPNNATLVIAGDVDPEATIATIRKLYEPIPRHPIPARPAIKFRPVKSQSFTLPSDDPYILTAVAFRMPGTDSPDFAATTILEDVLASQRGAIYGLVPAGKALDAGFELGESYRKASMGLAYAAIPTNANASAMDATLRKLLAEVAAKGVSAELVETAKRIEIADAEFERNSIPDLAELWSQALAAEGRDSPQQDIDAIKRVTVADVNRVAKRYLVDANAIVGTLRPEPSGAPIAGKGFGGRKKVASASLSGKGFGGRKKATSAPVAGKRLGSSEKVSSAPAIAVHLPAWAESKLRDLTVPEWNLHPSDTTLPNGIRLIVQTDRTTPTVTLLGKVRETAEMQTPPGKDGVYTVLDGLFSYGSTSMDRLAFQKALDDIAATESAGDDFSLQVLKQDFDRGLQLLADNELHPALPASAFKVVQQQTSQYVADLIESPDYRAEIAAWQALLPNKDPQLRHPTPHSVDSLTLDDVKSYYQTTFRPDFTTIVIIGDLTPDEARIAIEKYFGEWKAVGTKPALDLPPVPPNHAAAIEVPDSASAQDGVGLYEELPMNRFNPDYYALQVGNSVLGDGFYASRLYRDLREKTGYVYDVSNELDAGRTRTTFSISYGCDHHNVSKARTLVARDLRQMQAADVTPAELQQAKALLLRQIPLQEADEETVAQGLLERAGFGLPLDEPVLAARRYESISAEQVRLAFAKWIRPDDFVQVILGPVPQ